MKSTIARTDDGSVQITFDIPQDVFKKGENQALAILAKDVSVAGFRKGKAPAEKAKEKIEESKLIEKTLSIILPEIYSKTLIANKIQPITYPKFEIVKKNPWQIRAVVAELPIIDLPDYKQIVTGALRAASLKRELSKEEKETQVLSSILENIKIKIPQILIEDEVNARLSALLARLEKLGLKLEGYLASIGKTSEEVRQEYEKQVKDAISLELILGKIADLEKVEVSDKEIEETLKASSEGSKTPITQDQKRLTASILRRKKVLDQLVALL